MNVCYYCGAEIEFRYVGGVVVPIHVSGAWCPASGGGSSSSSEKLSKPFTTIESYVNPNAHCPRCGVPVFFYQSPDGGRVFFDDLGWPWPKHPCTDTRTRPEQFVKFTISRYPTSFRDASGEALEIFEIGGTEIVGDGVMKLKLGRPEYARHRNRRRSGWMIRYIDFREPPNLELTPEEVLQAPSILIAKKDLQQLTATASFINAKAGKISFVRLTKSLSE